MELGVDALNKEKLHDIAYSLDRFCFDKRKEYWRLLIPLLPKESYRYDRNDIEIIAFEGTKKRSPSLTLLLEFQKKGMRLTHFKSLLRDIGCRGALDCFQEPTDPVISKHPETKTVISNERLELECIANCIPEPPAYQWFYYDQSARNYKHITGAKDWKLVIDPVTVRDCGTYSCRVQNRRIKDADRAVFTYAKVVVKECIHPELETSGRSDTSLTSSCVQEVSQEFDGMLLSRSVTSFPSTDHTVFHDGASKIQVTIPSDSTDSGGLDQLIKIVEQPKDCKIKVKEKAFTIKLCCRAESPSGHQLNYAWYYLNASEKPGKFRKEKKTIKGTEPCLELSMQFSPNVDERRYCCEVSAAGHSEWSDAAVVKLLHFWIVEEPKEKIVVLAGNKLELSCKAESAPEVVAMYQWFKCNKDGNGKEPLQCSEDKFVVSEATQYNQHYYLCQISAKVSSRVACVEVVNSTEIKITKQPPTNRYMELNEDLVLECEAKCKHYRITYQWFRNNDAVPDGTDSWLVVKKVTREDLGSYHCEARSEYSSDVAISNTTRVEWKDSSLNTVQRLQLRAEEFDCGVTDKMALLIGNGSYKGRPLRCPRDDVKAVTEKLQELNFKTISLVDLTSTEMSKAVDYFCDHLDGGMYGLFYYSGHGLDVQKTTHLMPVDANDKQIKVEECVNYDVITQKMQKRLAKIISILDCCRTVGTAITQPLSSMPSNTQHEAFANIYEIYACVSSFEAFEIKGSKHSFCTQALLHALNLSRKKIKLDISKSIMDYYTKNNISPVMGKPFARPRVVDQLAHDISLDDPVVVPCTNKELLLKLPESVTLDFNHPTMKATYGHIQLDFEAEFSNVLIVHITCYVRLQPELDEQELDKFGLTAELACDVKNEGNKQVTSYRINNLLSLKDAVQNSGTPAQLKFSFQSPNNSTVKDMIVYGLPATLINPGF